MTPRTSTYDMVGLGDTGSWMMVKLRRIHPQAILVRAFDFLGEWQERAAGPPSIDGPG